MSPLRQQLAELMVSRAASPSPALGAGVDFITGLLGRDPTDRGGNQFAANPMLDLAARQARTTFADTKRPGAPINQLIGQGLEDGLNAAAPMQEDFIGQLFGRFNAPTPATPAAISPRYDLLSQFSGGEPLFDFGF